GLEERAGHAVPRELREQPLEAHPRSGPARHAPDPDAPRGEPPGLRARRGPSRRDDPFARSPKDARVLRYPQAPVEDDPPVGASSGLPEPPRQPRVVRADPGGSAEDRLVFFSIEHRAAPRRV